MEPMPCDSKRLLIATAMQSIAGQRSLGSIVGMVVGDAVGHPLEFLPVQDKPVESSFDAQLGGYTEPYNKFKLRPGQWTDDAAMGLCILDSLLLHHDFEASDVRVRFWNWWENGYNNSFRNDPERTQSVGLGGNIAASLRALDHLLPGTIPPPAYDVPNEDSGIGSLMRLAPVAVRFQRMPAKAVSSAKVSSYTTHPGALAAEACAFLAFMLVSAISTAIDPAQDVQQFLQSTVECYLQQLEAEEKQLGYRKSAVDTLCRLLHSKEKDDSCERCWNWKADSLMLQHTCTLRGSTYNGYPVSAGYFGSFCMDGLSMALWSVYHTKSFDDAIERCVNLCGDADSTAAVCGQIAGAVYGYQTINNRFISQMEEWDDADIAARAALLYQVASSE